MSERAVENLKREMERDLRAAEASRDRYLAELAESAPAAPGGVEGAPGDASSAVEAALAVLTDRQLPEDKRVEVIERLGASLSRHDAYIEALLAIVQDQSEPERLRLAGLQELGAAAFQVVRFRRHEQGYERALRNLVTDPDERVREAAVGVLALRQDPEVQQALLAGLRGDAPLPVSREHAIVLLAEDDHLDNLPWLQELYDSGSDDARHEAVRLMSSYPAARDRLEGVLLDKRESAQVRQQSAASLRTLAPERFEALAKAIATDETDDPEVRTATLNTLEHLGDAERVFGDAAFIERVRAMTGDESAPQVAEGARGLIEKLPEQ
jgi:HEAT repeats